MGQASDAEGVVRKFLRRVRRDSDVGRDTSLYADGIGLDSLATAELSAILEDELGADPFSESAEMPQTIGDILDYYEGSERA